MELEAIFQTSRIDSIKRSLNRAGYKFECAGRGKTCTITITALPQPPAPFQDFAMREFACGPQTNFEGMELFLSLLLFNPDFRYYPATYQAQYLKENYKVEISDQSLRNWKKKLVELNWIATDKNDYRCFACCKGKEPAKMDEEQYRNAWRQFYAAIQNGGQPDDARKDIYHQNHGMPRKQYGFQENAFELEKIDELRRILDKQG